MKRKRNFPKETLDYSSLIANICTIISFAVWLMTGNTSFVPVIAVLFFVSLGIMLLREDLPFDDIEVAYYINILNPEGDSSVQRDTRFVNNSRFTLTEREHLIFSTTSSSSRCDLKLEAWDNENNKLETQSLKDDPNLKRFLVKFSNPVMPKETYFYGYRYSWRRYFTKSDETFVGQDIAYTNEFIIKTCKNLKLKRVIAEELFHDGRRHVCQELKRDVKPIGNDVTEHHIKVVKKIRFNKVELLLTLEKQGA